jgi:hypothetical protein
MKRFLSTGARFRQAVPADRTDQDFVRSIVVFVLVGPPAGWIIMLLQLLFLSEAEVIVNGGVPAWLGLFAFGLPLSYVIGGAPALLTGLAHWLLRRNCELRAAFAASAAIGGLVGPIGAAVLWTFGDIGLPGGLRDWNYYVLPGACAASISALVVQARVSRMSGATAPEQT